MRTRRERRARAKQPSDCGGRRPGGIGLGGIGGKDIRSGRRPDRVGVAVEPLQQRWQVWGDKPYGLSGEAAERTLIAAMARRRVLGRSFIVVDLDAELRRVAEDSPEFGGDRGLITASEGALCERGRRRGGEKLNEEREGDDNRNQRRAPRDRPTAAL